MKTITTILLMIVGLSSNAQVNETIRLDYPTNVNTVIVVPNQVNLNSNYFFLDYNVGQGAVFSMPIFQNNVNSLPLLPLNLNNMPNNNILFTQTPISIPEKPCKKRLNQKKSQTMNKIYIVSYYIPDYDSWDICKYCSTMEIAEQTKQQLFDKIQNIKTTYYLEYDSDYDKDFSIYNDSDFLGDEWEDIADRVNIYMAKHEELSFTNITVEEKELI